MTTKEEEEKENNLEHLKQRFSSYKRKPLDKTQFGAKSRVDTMNNLLEEIRIMSDPTLKQFELEIEAELQRRKGHLKSLDTNNVGGKTSVPRS